MTTTRFEELFIDARLLRALGNLGLEETTEIQSSLVPEALTGVDIIASAPTGSGKTIAFLLPILQGLLERHAEKGWPKALVLVPTRELANQVRRVIESLTEYTRITSTVLIGGVHESLQQQWLSEQPDIVVATPGRLIDLLDKQVLDLFNMQYLVLDEADRMLDMGFVSEVASIIALLPATRQSLLFSATMDNPQVLDFARQILDEPVRIEVGLARQLPVSIDQRCHLADSDEHKQALLLALLAPFRSGAEHKASDPEQGRILVFVNTRTAAEQLGDQLHASGLAVAVLHGDMTQKLRNQKVRHFQGGRLSVLIATDVAARGLHIDAIDTVINYDMPRNAEIYLHRAGRTGRASQTGLVISLVRDFEARTLQRVERYTRQPIERSTLEGLAPVNREPEFRRRKKPKPAGKPTKKPRTKQRLRAQKNKGKPKLPLGKKKRRAIKLGSREDE